MNLVAYANLRMAVISTVRVDSGLPYQHDLDATASKRGMFSLCCERAYPF